MMLVALELHQHSAEIEDVLHRSLMHCPSHLFHRKVGRHVEQRARDCGDRNAAVRRNCIDWE
jgi:hypothetical protein